MKYSIILIKNDKKYKIGKEYHGNKYDINDWRSIDTWFNSKAVIITFDNLIECRYLFNRCKYKYRNKSGRFKIIKHV